jgi:hypothetical protein
VLILKVVVAEVSSLVRGKTMEVGRSSRYSSLGGSALSVELELFGENKNDLFGIILDSSSPSLGSDLPLYIKVGRVHGGLGTLAMVYVRQSPRGSCSGADGPWRYRRAKEALGVVRLLCFDMLSVRLCRLGPASARCTLWRLLGDEGIRLEEPTSGPRSPRAPEASGGVFVPLCHGLCVTLLEEWLIAPHLLGNAGKP